MTKKVPADSETPEQRLLVIREDLKKARDAREISPGEWMRLDSAIHAINLVLAALTCSLQCDTFNRGIRAADWEDIPRKQKVRHALTSGSAVFWPAGIEERYGISQPTRWKWERAGKLPPRDFKVGKRTGWKRETILAFDAEIVRAAVKVFQH